MEHLELVIFGLLVGIAAFAVLARVVGFPYPILLVVAGIALGFIPGVPDVELAPELVTWRGRRGRWGRERTQRQCPSAGWGPSGHWFKSIRPTEASRSRWMCEGRRDRHDGAIRTHSRR